MRVVTAAAAGLSELMNSRADVEIHYKHTFPIGNSGAVFFFILKIFYLYFLGVKREVTTRAFYLIIAECVT